jgi:hypothetical protein
MRRAGIAASVGERVLVKDGKVYASFVITRRG